MCWPERSATRSAPGPRHRRTAESVECDLTITGAKTVGRVGLTIGSGQRLEVALLGDLHLVEPSDVLGRAAEHLTSTGGISPLRRLLNQRRSATVPAPDEQCQNGHTHQTLHRDQAMTRDPRRRRCVPEMRCRKLPRFDEARTTPARAATRRQFRDRSRKAAGGWSGPTPTPRHRSHRAILRRPAHR